MEDRKSQIIQVATDLIKTYGYDSFSYKDLSEAVGITKATLHHHFAKKEDLGLAVLEVIMNQLAYLKEKTFEIADSKERLAFVFNSMRGTIKSSDICPISSLQAEFNVIPDSLKDMIAQISQNEVNLLSQVLEEGRQDGSLNFEGSAHQKALLMMTAYKGSIMYARTFSDETIETVLEGLIGAVMN